MPVNVAAITASDWQLELGALGEIVEGVDDVAQCMRTILRTPKGSVPHRPQFGSDLYRYIDWPLPAARPQIVRETIDALAANEPRIRVVRVNVESGATLDPALDGSLAVEVVWTVVGLQETTATSTLVIGRAAA